MGKPTKKSAVETKKICSVVLELLHKVVLM
jgi:hypothetical protein